MYMSRFENKVLILGFCFYLCFQDDHPGFQFLFEQLHVEMSAQDDFVHHDRVHALHDALVLNQAEQFLHHQDDHLKFVLIVLEIEEQRFSMIPSISQDNKSQCIGLAKANRDQILFYNCQGDLEGC